MIESEQLARGALRVPGPMDVAIDDVGAFDDHHLAALAAEHGTPLLAWSAEATRRAWRALAQALPGVQLHYALKALPHPAMLQLLAEEGASFDVCTPGEIALMRSLDIPASRCMHTHPIKPAAHIAEAVQWGCRRFIFDNRNELDKFQPFADDVDLLLRLSFRSPSAVVDLSNKFGANPHHAETLLAEAHARGFRVVGLAFHVGSQALSAHEQARAIAFCRDLMARCRPQMPDLKVLDIGGGFPVAYSSDVPAIEAYCQPIVAELAKLPADIEVLAEPGRYLAAPTMALVTSVIGRADREQGRWYYIDDGLYGSLSGRLFDHANYPLKALVDGELQPCVVAGPTCDGFDVVWDRALMPELQDGDLLVARMMGAYTWASASEFNLLPRTRIVNADTWPTPERQLQHRGGSS